MSAANNDTFSSEVAFVPVRVSQKATYNFKVLNQSFLQFINDASAKINALEEMSQDIVKSILLDSVKDAYFSKVAAAAEEKSDSKGGKKRKESETPQAPSSYLLFSNAKRDEIIKANPGIAFTDVGKKAGEMWKSLSDADKKPYIDQSNSIKEQIKAGTYVKPEKKDKKAKTASTSTKAEPMQVETPKAAAKSDSKKTESKKTEAPKAEAPKAAASKSKK